MVWQSKNLSARKSKQKKNIPKLLSDLKSMNPWSRQLDTTQSWEAQRLPLGMVATSCAASYSPTPTHGFSPIHVFTLD